MLKYLNMLRAICILLIIIIPSQAPSRGQEREELLIFAASSLSDSFDILAEAFEQKYDVQITMNYAGSSTLVAQLLQGAPADVFASANLQQMQNTVDNQLIDEQAISIFAENKLLIIVPADNPAQIESAEDLANPGVLVVLATPSVPVREYSNQLLETLSLIYGNDYQNRVLQNLVSEETNVRQVATRIVLGEADAGIVYRTDITENIEEDVTIIEIPEGANPVASYPIAPLIGSDNIAMAQLYIDFVLSAEGQSILREWGFCSPDSLLPETTPKPEDTPEFDEESEIEEFC